MASQDINGINSLITCSQQIAQALALINKTVGEAFPLWTAGQIPGTTTNGDATAGNIGEYISSNVTSGSPVSLVSATAKNITSISLTGGDWDVWGTVGFVANAATTATIFAGGISQTTNTLPIDAGAGAAFQLGLAVSAAGVMPISPVGSTRISLASTTTIYLVAKTTFAVNSMSGFGFIAARRRR